MALPIDAGRGARPEDCKVAVAFLRTPPKAGPLKLESPRAVAGAPNGYPLDPLASVVVGGVRECEFDPVADVLVGE